MKNLSIHINSYIKINNKVSPSSYTSRSFKDVTQLQPAQKRSWSGSGFVYRSIVSHIIFCGISVGKLQESEFLYWEVHGKVKQECWASTHCVCSCTSHSWQNRSAIKLSSISHGKLLVPGTNGLGKKVISYFFDKTIFFLAYSGRSRQIS